GPVLAVAAVAVCLEDGLGLLRKVRGRIGRRAGSAQEGEREAHNRRRQNPGSHGYPRPGGVLHQGVPSLSGTPAPLSRRVSRRGRFCFLSRSFSVYSVVSTPPPWVSPGGP